MLVQARRARTANTFAPLQERRSVGTGRVRWLFGPTLMLWMHAPEDQLASGNTAAISDDRSGKNVSIAQTIAARRPLKTNLFNQPAYQFDAINDWFDLGSVGIGGTQGITMALVERQTNSAFCYEFDLNTVAPHAYMARWNVVAMRNVSAAAQGNVGWSSMWTTVGYNGATTNVAVIDFSQPAGSEVALYVNGAVPATATGAANNTGTFSSTTGTIGAVATGAGTGPYGGFMCSALILRQALNAEQSGVLTTALQQATGIS